jgi:SOS-response transcriptional repressor LexA
MNEPVRPTKKQRELLDFIETFIAEHGYSPSYREIMNGLHYNSVATVALHISSLTKRGHLRKREHSARSLEVVRDPAMAASLAASAADAEGKAPSVKQHQDWLVKQIEAHIQRLAEAVDPKERTILSNPANHPDAHILLNALELLGFPRQADNLRQGFGGVGRLSPVPVPVEAEVGGSSDE